MLKKGKNMLSTKRMNIFKNERQGLIAFHGHFCGGLAIGMRALALAQDVLQYKDKADLLVVTETDMCGVDAIQYLSSCTYGKGNLIHKDYGKNAFTFYDKAQEKAVRIRVKTNFSTAIEEEAKKENNPQLLELLKENKENAFFLIDDDTLFDYKEIAYIPPKGAQVLQSFTCDACGEDMMESRARHYAGKTLCIPCFMEVEQKI